MKKPVIFAILLLFTVALLWGLDYLSSQPSVITKVTPIAKKMMAVYDFQKLTITDLPKEYYGKMISIKNTNDNKQIVTVQANGNVLVTDKLEHHQKLILECATCKSKMIELNTTFDPPSYHIAKMGDKLSRIGEIYGIKVDDIKRWNKLNNDNIKVGQKLCLTAPQGSVKPTGGTPTRNSFKESEKPNNSTSGSTTGGSSTVGGKERTLEQLKQEKINSIPADHPQKVNLKGQINSCKDKSCIDKITF